MPVEKAYYQRPESSPKRRRVEAPAQSTWEARGGYSDPAPPPWQRSYQDNPSTNRGSGGSGPGQSYGQRRSGGAVLSQAPSATSSSAAPAGGGSRGRYLMKDVKGGGSREYPSLDRR
ncbi:hypothetical protein Pmar_PMAR004026 [Perkinsus marinus ATCC 50983]|uniref:Uncharacterized protein n=1 Tax=Perkinsus marinus (strain ATCC 50983 / TXsc) TaxID=423536 RepID=C5M0I6_PERM5|nr:hypothetical protein Pmar_PMAR004026 [Perkinsus marinus ATCC 50983]EEQ97521.1 hypothetical protein Pmar_PMAR004026 [Perkinsus marinus ATCC 50983]|eukprot:XP_002764804.1 hypothetical protein Pmar_PMAR004026 [Perkinsus marinus ATCC 50983]